MAGHGPADGGHPGGRQTGERYTTGGHTCLRYGGREDTERVPTWRQGRRINNFYNHARRLRLEKLLYLELSRSSNGF
jgi:hypothetical protein